jgi:alkaline phosphatase
VVSTVPFTHATPACFVSHNPSRGNYKAFTAPATSAIDTEIATVVKPEVVIGGSHPTWDGGYCAPATVAAIQADPTWMLVQRQAGVTTAGADLITAAGQAVAGGKRLFGLFGGSGGNCEYYTVADAPGAPAMTQGSAENPTLPQAVTAALTVLRNGSSSTTPFFAMIEKGRHRLGEPRQPLRQHDRRRVEAGPDGARGVRLHRPGGRPGDLGQHAGDRHL